MQEDYTVIAEDPDKIGRRSNLILTGTESIICNMNIINSTLFVW